MVRSTQYYHSTRWSSGSIDIVCHMICTYLRTCIWQACHLVYNIFATTRESLVGIDTLTLYANEQPSSRHFLAKTV